MRVGSQLLKSVEQAEQLLARFEVRPEAVGPVVHELRYRDVWADHRSRFDSLLQGRDWKFKFGEVVKGESYRAEHAEKVKEKFQTFFHRDSFQAYQPVLVTFKAADLQRARIAG